MFTKSLEEVRRGLLEALEDPKNEQLWNPILEGITKVSENHPVGHSCQTCDDLRNRNSKLAKAEQNALKLRR